MTETPVTFKIYFNRFTGANIVGVTLNEYQVQHGNELNKKAGLEGKALLVQVNSSFDFTSIISSF